MQRLLAGRYELGALLGSGGMSSVRRAVDTRLDRPVAVKLLPTSGAHDDARRRFVREARAAASFSHPHAVSVYDAGEDAGFLFIAMELVDGPSLAGLLGRQGAFGVDETLDVGDQILSALAAAHQRGLVHRDVKPGNVLVAPDGAVKLADFGIAKSVTDITATLTRPGEVVGTPRYLSPEQAAGHPATPASDLYAVGVVLYEMLAGEPPFEGDSPVATLIAHQQAQVPPLSARRPEVPEDVSAVVERALEKEPARRYADAETMRLALRSPAGLPRTEVDLPTLPAAAAGGGEGPPTMPITRSPSAWRPGWRAAAVVGVLVGGAFAVAALTGSGPGEGTGTLAVTTTVAERETTTEPSTTTTAAPAPRSLGELTDLVADSPDAYGEKGEDLLKKLQEVQRERGRKREEVVRKAIEEITKWAAEGELDAGIAALSVEVLEQVRTPSMGGSGRD